MNASTTGSMRATLGLDFSQFESGARAAGKIAGGMADTMMRSGERVRQSVAGQTRSFDELRAAVDPAFAAAKAYAAIQQQVSGYVDSGAASQRAANIVLEQAAAKYMGVETAAQTASRAQRENATAVEMATRSYQSLRASLDPVYAASQRYEAAQETLNAAVRAGAITQMEANRVLAMAGNRYLGVVGPQNAAGAGANRMGSAFVNAGFQVQDFAVQVAGGQSAVLAFAQQLPQLLGVMGFTGKLAMWGAGLGVLAAVGGAVAMSFVNAAGKAKASASAVDQLTAAVSRYQKYADLAQASSTDLALQFGSLGTRAKALSGFIAEITQIEALRKANEAMSQLAQTYGGFSKQLGDMVMKPGANALSVMFGGFENSYMTEFEASLQKMQSELGLTEEKARLVANALAALTDAGTPTAQIEAATQLRDAFVQAFGSLKDVPPGLQAIAVEAGMVALSVSELPTEADKLAAAIKKANEELKASVESSSAWRLQLIDAAEKAQGMLGTLSQQNELARIAATYGADSLQLAQARQSAEMDVLRAQLATLPISESMKQQMLAAAQAGFDLANAASIAAGQISTAAGEAARLAANLGAAAVGAAQTADKQLAIVRAQIAAVAAGQDEVVRGKLTALDLDKQALRNAQLAAGVDAGIVETMVRRTFASREALVAAESQLSAAQKLRSENEKLASGGAKGGGAVAKGAKEAAKELDKARDAAEKLVETLNAPMASAIDSVANAWGDFASRGFADFKDFAKNVLGSFQSMISQMIATAAKNRIIISMGTAGGFSLSQVQAATQAQGAAGGGGMMGILGQIGGIGASLFSGAAGLVTSLFGAGGGLGAAGTYLSSVLGTATASIGGFAAAVGAIAGPLLAVAAVFSFFKKKTTLLDSGLRVTLDGMDALVETFRTIKTTKYWGLSKKVRTTYDVAPGEVADPIRAAVGDMQRNIMDMAGVLGIGSDAFTDFVHQITFSTKDMTDEQVMAELQKQMTNLGDAFAGLAFNFVGANDTLIASLQGQLAALDASGTGTADMVSGLAGFGNSRRAGLVREIEAAIAGNAMIAGDAATAALLKPGEGAMAMLERLANSLRAVNLIGDTLGHTFRAAGVAGAALASELVDAFGGLDAMNAATSRYYQAFYSDAERLATSTRQTAAALEEVGIIMPQTRAQYRAMIEALDVTTEAGRSAYAMLIGLSDTFNAILPAIGNLTVALTGMVGGVTTQIDAMIAQASEAQRANDQASRNWYQTSRTLRDVISKMRGTVGALTSASQAQAYNEAQYQTTLAAALAGDLAAAQRVAGASDLLLGSARDTARTATDLARIEARVLSDLGLLAGVSDIEGARHDVIAGLLTQQVDLLGEVRTYLNSGGALDEAQITALNTQLGSLERAIAAAEDISYARLRERIEVTVDILATADIPDDLRALIAAEQGELTRTIDFVLRSDLTAPERWLALNSTSEHIRTIDFVLGDLALPTDVQRLATDAAGVYVRTVRFLAANMMPANFTELALADASEMLRTIEFAAGALPVEVRNLVLNDFSTLRRTIDIMLGDTIPDEDQELALADATAFTRVLNIVSGRMVPEMVTDLALADPRAFQRRLNIVAGQVPAGEVRQLALAQATDFRRIIQLVEGTQLTVQTARIALATSSDLNRTLNLLVGTGLTSDLRTLALTGNSELSRTVNAILAADADPVAMRLALGNVGAYTVAIEAGFSLPHVGPAAQRVLFAQAGSYSAMIMAGFAPGIGPAAQRVLFAQQGQFITNITGVLVQDMPAATRALLLNANTTGARSVTIAAAFAEDLTPEQREALRISGTSVLRTITAMVNPAGISANGLLFLRQVSDGVATTVGRTIDGRVTLATLTPNDQRLLMLEPGTVGRLVEGQVLLGHMTDAQRRLLFADPASITRAISGYVAFARALTGDQHRFLWADNAVILRSIQGSVGFGGGLTPDQHRFLWAGDARISRMINGSLSLAGINADQLRLLRAETGGITRTIVGLPTLGGITADGLRLLRAETGSITRTITGIVSTGTLTPAQLALLSAINGGADGRLTLGGSFLFDPSGGFRAWYETATQTNLTAPMGALRTALDALVAAMLAENVRRDTEALHAARVAAANTAASGLARDAEGKVLTTAAGVAAVAQAAGISTTGRTAAQYGADVAALSATDSITGFNIVPDMRAYLMDQFRAGIVPVDGADYLRIYSDLAAPGSRYQDDPAGHYRDFGRAEILAGSRAFVPQAFDWSAIGIDIPGFAAGGMFGGGLRMVGENGPELEVTGPSKIYSAPQTRQILGGGDDASTVAELRAIRRELADMKDRETQLLLRIEANTKRSTDVARKWDADGLPAERV